MALDRRKFIKTLGAGAAVTALAPESLLASGSKEKERRSLDLKHTGFQDLNCDVCVVGAGPSGIPAASQESLTRQILSGPSILRVLLMTAW